MTERTGVPHAYVIAGSDCSGGAGVEADLATLRDLGVHGCSVITAITAQNRSGVQRVTATPLHQLRACLTALEQGFPASAVKLGMLCNAGIVAAVDEFLGRFNGPVVCDPVLGASAGGALLDDAGMEELRRLLPRITLLTPNRQEAQALSGQAIASAADVERAAHALRALGAGAVLVTGGHLELGGADCYDYFCSATQAFWLRGERIDTPHNHGTGCTLSSAIAGALAQGLALADAVVLGRMVVSHGLRRAMPLAGGSGAVAHGNWRPRLEDLPRLSPAFPTPNNPPGPGFPALSPPVLGLYPVVDCATWVERLFAEGVGVVQLRIKAGDEPALRASIQRAVAAQRRYGGRLFVNDHWRLAMACGAYGVHLGQEDLATADLAAIARAGLRLGTSNHAWHELARSHALGPSYIALGPIYATTTKAMRFAPQGLEQLQAWVNLLGGHYPLTAIGGIDVQRAPAVAATGVGSIAVVRAITEAPDYRQAVRALSRCLEGGGAGLAPDGINSSQDAYSVQGTYSSQGTYSEQGIGT